MSSTSWFVSLSLLGVIAIAVAACGDHGDGGGAVDAAGSVDAAPATTVVFLNFDGAALTKGFPDDPVNNVSGLIRPPGHTVPPWRDGMVGRDASIAAVSAGVRSILAPYDVEVVTQRPAAGPYEMIMFGGHARDLFGAGPIDVFGGNQCGLAPEISFVTESVTDDEVAASLTVGVLGTSREMPTTVQRGDCLCYAGQSCLPYTGELCTVGGAGTPTLAGPYGCYTPPDPPMEPPPTIDPHALFVAAFGAAR
jgi:hypothetical protein